MRSLRSACGCSPAEPPSRGISKLRGKHAPFEARRQLRKSHSLFLADKRIVPLLPPLLGNAFIRSKTLPVPVEIASPSPSLKAELERAVGGTTLRLGSGTCLNVKIGSLSRHSVDELRANMEEVVRHLAAKVPMGGWDNVQALHVKSGTSVALPVWNCGVGLGEGEPGRFSGPTEEEQEGRKRKREEKEQSKKEREERKKKQKPTSDPPEPKVAEKQVVPEAELSLVDGAPVPASTKPAPVASAEAGTTSGLETKRSKKTKGKEPGVTTEETVKVHKAPKRLDDIAPAPKEGKKPKRKVVETPAVPDPPVQPAVPATGKTSKGDRKALASSKDKPDGGDVPAAEKSAVKPKKSKDKEGKPRSSVGKNAKGTTKVKA